MIPEGVLHSITGAPNRDAKGEALLRSPVSYYDGYIIPNWAGKSSTEHVGRGIMCVGAFV